MSYHFRTSDKKAYESFKEYVLSKHGKLHGVLGEEIINALKFYMTSQGSSTHTPVKLVSNGKQGDLKSKILSEAEIGSIFMRPALENVLIRLSGNSDERSVKRMIRKLIAEHFLERVWDDLSEEKYKIVGNLETLAETTQV